MTNRAAEQDGGFRAFFYEVLLPELKGQRKMVIVITHDIQFARISDVRIRIVDGRMASFCRAGMESGLT